MRAPQSDGSWLAQIRILVRPRLRATYAPSSSLSIELLRLTATVALLVMPGPQLERTS